VRSRAFFFLYGFVLALVTVFLIFEVEAQTIIMCRAYDTGEIIRVAGPECPPGTYRWYGR
jgi:hypothetical protein